MADNTTLGQYLKMMKDAEQEDDVNEVDTTDPEDEHPNVYGYGYNKNYDEEDSYDIVIDELGIEDDLRNIDDEQEESEADTIYSTYFQDENSPYWDSKEDFVKDIKDYITNFDPETITDYSPYPNYNCRDFLILGITLENGLMVVTKCYDPEMNQKNLLFYVTDQPLFVREIDHTETSI